MPFTVTMPKLSPTMEEGAVARWHKKEGEFVKAGELLVEIATDKATVEHTALDEGWLRRQLAQPGQSIRVNQPIAVMSAVKDENIDNYQPEAIELNFPQTEQREELLEVAKPPSDKKQTMTQVAMAAPVHIPEPPLQHYEHPYPSEAPAERILASPLAKQMAKKMGLDLRTVKGSGPGGRITTHDLEKAQPEGIVTFGRVEAPHVNPGSFKEIPLSPMRKAIARRLQESKSYIPHFYVKQIIHVDHLVALRDQLLNLGLKVSYNDLVIRGAALALRQHPRVNVGFHSLNQSLIQYETVDISIAVNLEDGLITPIIRHADFKNVGQIAAEIKVLAQRAREGSLKEHEYKGGSFCVSNLGMYGITEFTAVINPPQAAILAVGAIEQRPIIKNDAVVPGQTMSVTLSADHRVIDGALAAQFLKTLQHILENPVSLTL